MTPRSVSLKAADALPSPSVQVALSGLDAGAETAQWVMVAKEGIFLGYNAGENPFQFTRETFDQIVANVRSHPSFAANDDGVGTANVVPWDFDHASEQGSTAGSLPTTGAPAQAWTLDAEVRDGAQGAELWALTNFLPTAKEYVRNGQYQWASVAVSFDAIHPRTGQNVGAMMSSIALTNTPFIEGMEKLVASRAHRAFGYRRGPAPADVTASTVHLRGWYEAAESPMDAVRMLKELFGQSETDGIDEVFGELNKVAAYVVSGAPLGVDVDHLVSSIRKILNLPALLPETEVVATAIAQLQSIIENQPSELAPTPAVPPATDSAAEFAASKETQDMDELIKALASKLGVRASEQSVVAAIDVLCDTNSGVVKALNLAADVGSERIVLAAGEAAGARATLEGLFTALGVEDATGSVDKVASLMKQAGELEAAMPELAALRDEKAKAEAESEEADVDEAIAASKFPASLKTALLLQRKEMGHDKFVETFPAPESTPEPTPVAAAVKAGITGALATDPTGTQLAVVGGKVVKLGASPDAKTPALPAGDVIDVAMHAGSNFTAKVKSYLSAEKPGFKDMSYDDQMTLVLNFKKQSHVVCSAGA